MTRGNEKGLCQLIRIFFFKVDTLNSDYCPFGETKQGMPSFKNWFKLVVIILILFVFA